MREGSEVSTGLKLGLEYILDVRPQSKEEFNTSKKKDQGKIKAF